MLKLWIRLLTFRATAEELQGLHAGHLAAGLAAAWLAGIGRYWDHPSATLLQHLGVGSVAYVVALSTLLWLILAPLRPPRLSYLRLMAFVAMTSPPALLYAIPVERFLDAGLATKINLWFLVIVALWRVALAFSYFRRGAGLDAWDASIGLLAPLLAIICSLAALNLDHVVFNIMAGVEESRGIPGSGREQAYALTVMLSFLSILAALPVGLAYLITSIGRWLPGERPPDPGGDPASPPVPSAPPPESPA